MEPAEVGKEHWLGFGKLRCWGQSYHEVTSESDHLTGLKFLSWRVKGLDLLRCPDLLGARDQDGCLMVKWETLGERPLIICFVPRERRTWCAFWLPGNPEDFSVGPQSLNPHLLCSH